MKQISMVTSTFLVLACGVLSGAPAFAGAVAQPQSQSQPQADAQEITDAMVAREMARVVSMDLGLRQSPKPDDYALVGHALSMAVADRPGDAELARLAASAAWAAGDRDMLLSATRAIIKADPSDTVAQLRLISSNINSRQTVESRLQAYDRILGDAGKSLHVSVRSRLALDAALLLRESGDQAGFERRLREAITLDITNKEAVSLAARTFATAESGIEELLDWQIRLLFADPFDPHVHLTIARISAGQGAIESAQRFLENGVALYAIAGSEIPAHLREQRLALQWQREGAEIVLEELNGPLEDMRAQAAALIKIRQEAGEPIDDIRNPADILYELGIERVRLLAAASVENDASIDASLADMARSTQTTLDQLAKAMRQPGANQTQFAEEIVKVFGDLQIMRGLVGRDTEKMLEETESFVEAVPQAGPMVARVKPWVAYARGEFQQAIELAEAGGPGPLQALVVALASEQLGDVERAVGIYTQFARGRPLDAYGGYARTRLQRIGRDSEALTTDGAYLESRLAKLPKWLDRMLTEPRSFMLLQVDAPLLTTDPLGTATVRVRLRNTSPIPLGVGSSRPIGTRFLITPRSVGAESDFGGALRGKVVDLDSRFRLETLEEIEVVLDADAPYAKWLRTANAHVSQRDRYRVIQSFQPGPLGGLVPGPLGLVGETGLIQRNAFNEARIDIDGLIEEILSSEGTELRSWLIVSVCRLLQPEGSSLSLRTSDKARVADAWRARFERANDAERAMILLCLPHAGQVFEFESFDQQVTTAVASGEPSEQLLVATLMTRVRAPGGALFDKAAKSESQSVRTIGSLLNARLEAFDKSYATVGPGLNAMGPPTDVLGTGRGR